jgi:hypothetical protein
MSEKKGSQQQREMHGEDQGRRDCARSKENKNDNCKMEFLVWTFVEMVVGMLLIRAVFVRLSL